MADKRITRVYTPEEKRQFLEGAERTELTLKEYAASVGVPLFTLHQWRSKQRRGRDPSAPSKKGCYKPEQRKQAIEAYRKSGMSAANFAKTWGVSEVTLHRWLRCEAKYGMNRLELKTRNRSRKGRKPRLGAAWRTRLSDAL
jgi:transposase-like protein